MDSDPFVIVNNADKPITSMETETVAPEANNPQNAPQQSTPPMTEASPVFPPVSPVPPVTASSPIDSNEDTKTEPDGDSTEDEQQQEQETPAPRPLSAQDEKDLARIASVHLDVDKLEAAVLALRDRYLSCLSHAALFRWLSCSLAKTSRMTDDSSSSPSTTTTTTSCSVAPLGARALKASTRLGYDCGCLAEALLRSLCSLDSVQTDHGQVRAARKAEVLRCHRLQAAADQVGERVRRMLRKLLAGVDEKAAAPASAAPAAVSVPAAASSSSAPPSSSVSAPSPASPTDAAAESKAMEDDDEDTKTTPAPSSASSASPSPPRSRPASPSKKSESQQKTSPSSHPPSACHRHPKHRYKPQFQQRQTAEGLLLAAHLPGVRKSDLDISVDKANRTLTISGVRRPSLPPLPFPDDSDLAEEEEALRREDAYIRQLSWGFSGLVPQARARWAQRQRAFAAAVEQRRGEREAQRRERERRLEALPLDWFEQTWDVPAEVPVAVDGDRVRVSLDEEEAVLRVLLPFLPRPQPQQQQRRSQAARHHHPFAGMDDEGAGAYYSRPRSVYYSHPSYSGYSPFGGWF